MNVLHEKSKLLTRDRNLKIGELYVRWIFLSGVIFGPVPGHLAGERSCDRWPRAALWIALAVSKGILGPFLTK